MFKGSGPAAESAIRRETIRLAVIMQPTGSWRVFLPTMNRLPLITLGVLVLASAGFGIYQLNKVQKLTQNVAAWDAERAALQKKIWELQRQNGDLERRRAGSGPVAANEGESGARGAGRANSPGVGEPPFRARVDGGRFGAMLNNPEAQKLMAVQQKGALDSRYSSLFKQLNLSPADLEKFKNLLVEKQSAVMDVMAAARSEGLTGRENRDQIRELVQNAQNEVDNTIRSTLGDAAYSQYQNYEATQPQRAVVSQLEQRLSYSPTPLTDTQSQQLVQILAQTSPTTTNEGNGGRPLVALGSAGGGGMFFGGPTITADAVNRAQGVLTPEQLTALQSLQQEQQASALLRQQMRANFQNPAQASPVTTVNQIPLPKSGTAGTE